MVGGNQREKTGIKSQFCQPERSLISVKDRFSQLNIQQPVISVVGLRSFMIKQEFLTWFLAQKLVFDAKLIVSDLQFFNRRKIDLIKGLAKFFFGIVPKHYPIFIEQTNEGIFNLRHYSAPPNKFLTSPLPSILS